LSGTPTALTTKGAVIYQDNCKPLRSIVSLFESRGYTTVGLHPYLASGYNRDSMYDKAFDFDESYFLEDLPEEQELVRKYVSDSANYKELIRLYEDNEKSGDSPFFCFNVTMQNHGGYTTNQLNDIIVDGHEDNTELSTYLSSINRSDDALIELFEYFESVEEDTIILIFGDHQPLIDVDFYGKVYGKDYESLSIEELKEIYAVPYLIWANYELDKAVAPEETSICYLSSILFEVGNIPKSKWLNMVDEYQKSYPVVSEIFTKDAEGNIYDSKSLLKRVGENDVLRLYQKYSHGILYGVGQ
jgi:hypothetical protein